MANDLFINVLSLVMLTFRKLDEIFITLLLNLRKSNIELLTKCINVSKNELINSINKMSDVLIKCSSAYENVVKYSNKKIKIFFRNDNITGKT